MAIRSILFTAFTLLIFGCKKDAKNSKFTEEPEKNKTDTIIAKTTALPNVIILEKKFEITNLNRERQIRIYLPSNYKKSDKKYPVLYMHDAQNLFDKFTSYAGEWEVDESLYKLEKTSGIELIVVGIDNGGEKRMNELSPWKNEQFGEAEGKEYMDFIINQIKPYVDNNYRTLSDSDNTAIMGSSMGGLISHYALYQYPEVFSKAGVFSPSYWYSEDVFTFTKEHPVPKEARLYLMVGKKEGDGMTENTIKMYEQIIGSNHPNQNIHMVIDPKGKHNEALWKKHFSSAVKWLFTK